MSNLPNKISIKGDYKELKLYINDLLHLQYNKEGHLALNSWIEGYRNQKYVIEFLNEKGFVTLEYDNRPLWESVLKTLDSNI